MVPQYSAAALNPKFRSISTKFMGSLDTGGHFTYSVIQDFSLTENYMWK